MAEHKYFVCPPDCEKAHCIYCHGGLSFCTTCNGGEASLPSECPGKPMSEEMENAVCRGRIDFQNGKWGDGPGTPYRRFHALWGRAKDGIYIEREWVGFLASLNSGSSRRAVGLLHEQSKEKVYNKRTWCTVEPVLVKLGAWPNRV